MSTKIHRGNRFMQKPEEMIIVVLSIAMITLVIYMAITH